MIHTNPDIILCGCAAAHTSSTIFLELTTDSTILIVLEPRGLIGVDRLEITGNVVLRNPVELLICRRSSRNSNAILRAVFEVER